MKVGEGEREDMGKQDKDYIHTYMVGYHWHNDHEALVLVLDDERIGLG
jgi:hypothetical protein